MYDAVFWFSCDEYVVKAQRQEGTDKWDALIIPLDGAELTYTGLRRDVLDRILDRLERGEEYETAGGDDE